MIASVRFALTTQAFALGSGAPTCLLCLDLRNTIIGGTRRSRAFVHGQMSRCFLLNYQRNCHDSKNARVDLHTPSAKMYLLVVPNAFCLSGRTFVQATTIEWSMGCPEFLNV